MSAEDTRMQAQVSTALNYVQPTARRLSQIDDVPTSPKQTKSVKLELSLIVIPNTKTILKNVLLTTGGIM